MLTPSNVHSGDAEKILIARGNTKSVAFKRHRERFVKGCPKVEKLEREVWINPPKTETAELHLENQEVKVLKAKKAQK